MSGEQPWPAWATEPVDLVDADPSWTIRGDQERHYLETLLAPWLIARIEHIGSTAIPDLPAKPIIDLQAPVADLRDPDPIAAALAPTTGITSNLTWTSDPGGASSSKSPAGGAAPTFTS